MPDKSELREAVKSSLEESMAYLNEALDGEGLHLIEPIIARLGRGNVLPHWYEGLKSHGTLPNLDGKTIGSVLEMIFVAILETRILKPFEIPGLRINPARGVDLPDLDLGIKSPSTNFCTSEPFFSAYERLYGNEYDCVVMLTDYQDAKKAPPLKLQIINWKYLRGSEIADENLCLIARKHREWLLGQSEAHAKRVFRFLAYVNQSDWRAKQLLTLVHDLNNTDEWFDNKLGIIIADYAKQNAIRTAKDRELIPESDLISLLNIKTVSPRYIGVMDQIENWIADTLKDASRAPNENEWNRLLRSPLDGKIGMSFALQWRYNFGRLFNGCPSCDEVQE